MKGVDVSGYSQRLAYHQNQLQILHSHLLSNIQSLAPVGNGDSLDITQQNKVVNQRIDHILVDLRNTLNSLAEVLDEVEQYGNDIVSGVK